MPAVPALPPKFSASLTRAADAVQILCLHGEVDLVARPAFLDALRPLDGEALVIDLAGVSFLDSTGVRGLIDVRRRYPAGGLALACGVTGPARRILELISLPSLIPTFPTVDEAVASCLGSRKPGAVSDRP